MAPFKLKFPFLPNTTAKFPRKKCYPEIDMRFTVAKIVKKLSTNAPMDEIRTPERPAASDGDGKERTVGWRESTE